MFREESIDRGRSIHSDHCIALRATSYCYFNGETVRCKISVPSVAESVGEFCNVHQYSRDGLSTTDLTGAHQAQILDQSPWSEMGNSHFVSLERGWLHMRILECSGGGLCCSAVPPHRCCTGRTALQHSSQSPLQSHTQQGAAQFYFQSVQLPVAARLFLAARKQKSC